MADVELVPATLELLRALHTDRAAFGDAIGSAVPQGWPEFPEAIEFTLTKLRTDPIEHAWWMHFFLVDGDLVGSGGFVGPPVHGGVEIGYEIAPQFRRRGYATAAAGALVAKAVAGGATTVIAHTLPENNPSTRVLRTLGFTFGGEVADPDEGLVWRWELAAQAS